MKITVFTPTYNRGDLLPILYNSLVEQTYKDFEWVIVDDGSTDTTEAIVKDWLVENIIKINYYKQKNGGKHRAINKGVDLAKGELFFIVDSDDYLPTTALKIVNEKYKEAKGKYEIAGVAGRRMFKDENIVGSNNFKEILTNSIDIRYKYNVTGDLVEVFEVEVLKQYPFPEFDNEKFCPEATIWNRIAVAHNLYFFNEGIYVTEYIAGGLTANIVKIRMQSPQGAMLCYSELEKHTIPFLQKIKANTNFWRFSFNSNFGFFKRLKMVSSYLSVFGIPIGFIMYLKDKKSI